MYAFGSGVDLDLPFVCLMLRGMAGRQHMNSNNRPMMMRIISNTHTDINM